MHDFPNTMSRLSLESRLLAPILACLMLLIVPGCSDDWDQGTPEATIKTARILVEKNRARELHKLIYPETPEMTGFLQKMGVLMGNLQKLAVQVEKSLPDEIATIKAKAAATSGKAADILGQLASQTRGRRGRPDFKQQEAQQEALRALIENLFADPYQFLREGEQHLSTAYLTDDTVSLRWKDEPILAPIGLSSRVCILRDDRSNVGIVNKHMHHADSNFKFIRSHFALVHRRRR